MVRVSQWTASWTDFVGNLALYRSKSVQCFAKHSCPGAPKCLQNNPTGSDRDKERLIPTLTLDTDFQICNISHWIIQQLWLGENGILKQIWVSTKKQESTLTLKIIDCPFLDCINHEWPKAPHVQRDHRREIRHIWDNLEHLLKHIWKDIKNPVSLVSSCSLLCTLQPHHNNLVSIAVSFKSSLT